MKPGIFHTEVFFTGHVIGVGFCYQAFQIAKEFDVSGYVKSLSDGRVVCEAEGDEREVSSFLNEIESQLDAFIHKTEYRSAVRNRSFSGFTMA